MCDYICRIVGLQNQLNDANEKFREQLMQTEQQVEAKWIDHIKEKDKRFNTSYIIIICMQYSTYVHVVIYVRSYICTRPEQFI